VQNDERRKNFGWTQSSRAGRSGIRRNPRLFLLWKSSSTVQRPRNPHHTVRGELYGRSNHTENEGIKSKNLERGNDSVNPKLAILPATGNPWRKVPLIGIRPYTDYFVGLRGDGKKQIKEGDPRFPRPWLVYHDASDKVTDLCKTKDRAIAMALFRSMHTRLTKKKGTAK